MGFIDDIKEIMAMLPEDKQTVLFSATMSRDIEKHVHSFLKNPAQVTIKSEPVGSRVAQEVVLYTTGMDKKQKLHDLLQKDKEGKYLIFTRTKREADRVLMISVISVLRLMPSMATSLTNLRQRITNNFRTSKINTHRNRYVAARGLDIPDVCMSSISMNRQPARIMYTESSYTARAGKQGTAYTFVKGGEY